MTTIISINNNSVIDLKINFKQFLLTNVHLGHTKRYLNVKIKPFLLGKRNSVYILNLVFTNFQFKTFLILVINYVSLRQKILIVKDREFFNFRNHLNIKNIFYYDKKWIGGSLTNYKKVRQSLKFKEFNYSLNSLKAMRYLPFLVFFFDSDLSYWALRESSNLDIPISSMIDTNIDTLEFINYPIVGNNKSFEACFLYLNLIKNAALKGRQKELFKILSIV